MELEERSELLRDETVPKIRGRFDMARPRGNRGTLNDPQV